MAALPALSALAPFLLLVLITHRVPLDNPSLVFGLALVLVLVLLGVARAFGQPLLAMVGLGGVLLLEGSWQWQHFRPVSGGGYVVAWALGFGGVFLLFPFVTRRVWDRSVLPWAAAALSLPMHFPLVHRAVKLAWPNDFIGLLPAAGVVPMGIALWQISRWLAKGNALRLPVQAWFGGATLYFVTLIFPIQFDRQWITLGWALEGASLCWLFGRLPHPGLRLVGVGLLAAAFARLALNPAVLSYHPRSGTALVNWYLYTYGITIAALFAGARLLAPPRDRIGSVQSRALLLTLATVLLFLLVNIEVADAFAPPGRAVLTFEFSGNFARDMSYTIAWAVFALGLVVIGLIHRRRAVRYAGLGLFSVTLLKLFLHDLEHLNQLYRIGALVAVAVVAILAAFLYQKFLAEAGESSCRPK